MQNNHINESNQVLDCNMKTGETAVLTHKLYTMVARGTIFVHFLVLKNVPCNVCVCLFSFLFENLFQACEFLVIHLVISFFGAHITESTKLATYKKALIFFFKSHECSMQ